MMGYRFLTCIFVPPVWLAFDSRGGGTGGSRRAFGTGFRRDYDDNRSSGDRYGERERYGGDREDRYERREAPRDDKGEPRTK